VAGEQISDQPDIARADQSSLNDGGLIHGEKNIPWMLKSPEKNRKNLPPG
jgi:hypothetical protein